MLIRKLLRILHIIAGLVAFITILRFLGLTFWTELAGSGEDVIAAKSWIVSRLPPLVLSFVIVGGTGFILSGGKPKGLALTKLSRMKVIAPNGLFVLVPAALFLHWKAGSADFDAFFYVVQAIEVLAGAANLLLLALCIRDGLKMKGRFRQIRA